MGRVSSLISSKILLDCRLIWITDVIGDGEQKTALEWCAGLPDTANIGSQVIVHKRTAEDPSGPFRLHRGSGSSVVSVQGRRGFVAQIP